MKVKYQTAVIPGILLVVLACGSVLANDCPHEVELKPFLFCDLTDCNGVLVKSGNYWQVCDYLSNSLKSSSYVQESLQNFNEMAVNFFVGQTGILLGLGMISFGAAMLVLDSQSAASQYPAAPWIALGGAGLSTGGIYFTVRADFHQNGMVSKLQLAASEYRRY